MNAKELERFLSHFGAVPSQVDVVIRKMRAAFNVSTGGRGINAANLKTEEIAWIICAFAGSDVASKADHTFKRLMQIEDGAKRWPNFVLAVQLIVMGSDACLDVDDIDEIRICRNFPLAKILCIDGAEYTFALPQHLEKSDGMGKATFRSEGVLSGGLIRALRLRLDDEGKAGELVAD